ncbi:MAG: OmpA family protein [Marinifilaceae bacterium]
MRKHYILFIVMVGLAVNAAGQRMWMLKGDRAYSQKLFSEAAEQYRKGISSSSDSLRNTAFLKLGKCYTRMHHPAQAAQYFEQARADKNQFTSFDLVEYGKVLMELKEYEKAMELFSAARTNPESNARYWIKACEKSLNETKVDSIIDIKLIPLPNIHFSHGISLTPDGILGCQPKYTEIKGSFQPAFAHNTSTHTPTQNSVWNLKINLPLNFNSPCLNTNDSVLYYSGNRSTHTTYSKRNRHKRNIGKDGFNNLYIWQLQLNKQKLVPIELPFNSSEYSCTHPFITKDGKKLYFVSNMPGGYGGFDLYYTEKKEGRWSTPTNLGPQINTRWDEAFPFVKDGVLYFASQGHYGYGGLDIFKVDLEKGEEVVNLGQPVNSSYDDFCYRLQTGNEGYLVSNRFQEDGKDRLWHFMKIKPEPVNPPPLLPTEDLIVKMEKFQLKDSLQKIHPKKTLDSNEKTVTLNLGTVYFNFAEADIKSEYHTVLDHIVDYLSANTNIVIEIGAHTDSRGSKEFNRKLSQKRAHSIFNYLVSKGISQNRMIQRGYGETQLLNQCNDNSDCNEEAHQANRRVELKPLPIVQK